MTRTVWFVIAVCLVTLAIIILPVVLFQKWEIVAEERINLLASPDQSSEIVGHLDPGTRTWVTGCYDIHHYIVYQVRFDGDRVGYLHYGKFSSVWPRGLRAWRAPIAWWCR